jgi:hypothetical protein
MVLGSTLRFSGGISSGTASVSNKGLPMLSVWLTAVGRGTMGFMDFLQFG